MFGIFRAIFDYYEIGICWPSRSAEMCRGFLLYGFGGFCRGFFWALFPKKDVKSTMKSGSSKTNVTKNPFCPNPALFFTPPENEFYVEKIWGPWYSPQVLFCDSSFFGVGIT